MLSPDIINAVRTLLARVDLKGQEVPAFNKIMLALSAEENEAMQRARPQLSAVPTPDIAAQEAAAS